MALSAEHLRTMLVRCQERWPDVRCTFGQIAFWSAHIGRDGEDVRVVHLAAWLSAIMNRAVRGEILRSQLRRVRAAGWGPAGPGHVRPR